MYSANWRSNSFVFGPVVIQPDFKVSITSLISSSVISGGENGILYFSFLNSYFITAKAVLIIILISFITLIL